MNIVMFGAGYVGLVTGACFSALGHNVSVIDIDSKRIKVLQNGQVPIYEPGLAELIAKNAKMGRLHFSTEAGPAIKKASALFIAVGTPSAKDGSSDLSAVFSVAKAIALQMDSYKLIVIKSTVPVGTSKKVQDIIQKNLRKSLSFAMASNPEFLREGSAIRDFMVPDRIVIGADSDKAREMMAEIYEGITRSNMPLVFTSIPSAELIKYAANAMLASRISFMNQLAPLCEMTGADIKEIAKGIGFDDRIGPRFLQAGIGYGGSCFPKDVLSLAATLKERGLVSDLIDATHAVNERQKESLLPKIQQALSRKLNGKTIALWGLSFKPKTDDMREASSLVVVRQLLDAGAKVRAFDPVAMENAKRLLPAVTYTPDMYTCVRGADCLVLVTEWDEFRNPDWQKVAKSMRQCILIDGRNVFDPPKMEAVGFMYFGVGRK